MQLLRNLVGTRMCTLCGDANNFTPTRKAKLLWMTPSYGQTVVRSVTDISYPISHNYSSTFLANLCKH